MRRAAYRHSTPQHFFGQQVTGVFLFGARRGTWCGIAPCRQLHKGGTSDVGRGSWGVEYGPGR